MDGAEPIANEEAKLSNTHGISRQHAVGFGCAGLYKLPRRRDRLATLHAAYELGIRHFDVAPMYGLGLAEAELGEFIRVRNDVRVATKFGIRPTAAARLAGLAQPPIRKVLQRYPMVQNTVKKSGGRPDSGVVGRILYSHHDYSVANARRALAESLRTLRVERIDYFFLHEPAGHVPDHYLALVEYLEFERSKGVIGHWGPAGDLSRVDTALAGISNQASALQYPYDLISGYSGPGPVERRFSITFGFISAALPLVGSMLAREPVFLRRCSELLDADLADKRTLVRLLVRNAVTSNQLGTVLLTSTNPRNLEMAYAAAKAPLRNEAEVASLIRQKCLDLQVER
jgi:D-threo-aldose 1-dehydrogenase